MTKDFIDCEGGVRHEKVVILQLWDADNYGHCLEAGKLMNIISLSEKVLGIEDLQIEVEYQSRTTGKYDLSFDGKNFLLLSKQTACLAREACGVEEAPKKGMINLAGAENSFTTGGGCC